jgi:hypothetical protein
MNAGNARPFMIKYLQGKRLKRAKKLADGTRWDV